MTEITKDTFWTLIDQVKKEHGQDMDACEVWLKKQLKEMGPQAAQGFHDILNGYKDLANGYGLWSAASIMCENGCSDDGFIDFRTWLIAQGKEVYLAALADPDSLADVEAYGGCQWETLAYTGYKALKELTGRDAYRETDQAAYDVLVSELQKDITYSSGINYPYEWDEVQTYFPRLCAKYLEPGVPDFMLAQQKSMWFLDNVKIQEARKAGPQGQAVPDPKSHIKEEFPERDIEQVIAGMKAETIREIQRESVAPAGKLAWYWSYIGSLDMAQALGLIDDSRRQALYREIAEFKPDCAITFKETEQKNETAEMTIGGIT